jgi:Flp pilus assembly protein TadD
MIIALNIVFTIMGIVSFVSFIIVLVKSFKHGGILKGLLGLITCGLFTFIWGWLKHKQLRMTKIMTIWSIIIVVETVGTGILFAMGVSSAMMDPQLWKEIARNSNVKLSNPQSNNKISKPKLPQKKKTMKSNPQVPKQNVDWSQKALALWQGDQYKNPHQAVDYWNRAILNQQNTAVAYSNRGLAYHELKQYQKAVKDYNAAIKRDPDYAAAYSNRGNSYYELTEYQLALNDFNQSLKLKPKNAKAHLNRGLVFYQMDKNLQACQDFQSACDQGDCDGIKWAMKNKICN